MSILLTGSFDLETFINTYPSGSTDTINLWVSASYSGGEEKWYLKGVTVPVSYTQEEGEYLGLILRQAQRIGIFLPNPSPVPTPTPTATPTPTPTPDCSLSGSITCS